MNRPIFDISAHNSGKGRTKMTKLPREELQKIIEQDLPGYRMSAESTNRNEGFESADSVSADTGRQAEASTPDLQALRMKYLQNTYLGSDSKASKDYSVTDEGYETNSVDETSNLPEDEIIAVTPETSAHPWDRSARPKAAVISGREKKVIGQQG